MPGPAAEPRAFALDLPFDGIAGDRRDRHGWGFGDTGHHIRRQRIAGGKAGVLAVPVSSGCREVEDRAPAQRPHQDLVGGGIDDHVIRVALADDDIAARRVAGVDEAMPRRSTSRKADVVAGLHGVGSVADISGQHPFEDEDMLFLENMVMRRRRLLARRQFLDRHADMVVFAEGGLRQMPVAHTEARHIGPFRPWHAVRCEWHGRFIVCHRASLVLSPCPRRTAMLLEDPQQDKAASFRLNRQAVFATLLTKPDRNRSLQPLIALLACCSSSNAAKRLACQPASVASG